MVEVSVTESLFLSKKQAGEKIQAALRIRLVFGLGFHGALHSCSVCAEYGASVTAALLPLQVNGKRNWVLLCSGVVMLIQLLW